ncbi:MAG: hypothetical protein OXG16_10090 [Rhodospirillales bacterium]|nr:hypothetical protein [Rhodospirillales bacterium]
MAGRLRDLLDSRYGHSVPPVRRRSVALLFSDAELHVLATIARSRKTEPPTCSDEAVDLVARSDGRPRRSRGLPGAQLMWRGSTQLVAMTFTFELRDEYE